MYDHLWLCVYTVVCETWPPFSHNSPNSVTPSDEGWHTLCHNVNRVSQSAQVQRQKDCTQQGSPKCIRPPHMTREAGTSEFCQGSEHLLGYCWCYVYWTCLWVYTVVWATHDPLFAQQSQQCHFLDRGLGDTLSQHWQGLVSQSSQVHRQRGCTNQGSPSRCKTTTHVPRSWNERALSGWRTCVGLLAHSLRICSVFVCT